jgi:AbrB family transcriptional regulator (stage V sporulation protein T)
MAAIKMKMDKNNRVLIPAELRERLGISAGDPFYADIDETGVRLKTRMDALAEIQRAFAPYSKDHEGSLVDEIIADRREEARREEEEEAAQHL